MENLQQVAEKLKKENLRQVAEKTQSPLERLESTLFSVPWGHHMLLIDKCSDAPQKALFFACQTVENGWSRSSLLFYPEKVEGTMPSIEEIEKRLCEVPL